MKRCVDTISLLLAALFLVSCAEEAVSESGRSDGGNTVIPDNTAVGADSGERDEAKLAPDLPDDLSFDGDSFRFLSRHEPSCAWNVLDAYAEGLTGEVLNDAIFQRNEEVTERLGVVLTETVAEPLVFIHFSAFSIFRKLPASSTKIRYRPIGIIIL